MKKPPLGSLLLCLVLGAAPSLSARAQPAQVLLIRHGEKPDVGNELSPRGWERARALPRLFHGRAEFLRFGAPAALVGMSPSKSGGSVRAIQTLQFAAEDLHLRTDTSFQKGQESALAREILSNPAWNGKLVVVCWEHKNLQDIALALGMPNPPDYPGEKFDRAWLLSFGRGGFTSFEDLPEKLLDGDDEN